MHLLQNETENRNSAKRMKITSDQSNSGTFVDNLIENLEKTETDEKLIVSKCEICDVYFLTNDEAENHYKAAFHKEKASLVKTQILLKKYIKLQLTYRTKYLIFAAKKLSFT